MKIAFYISLYDAGIKRRITDMVSVLSKHHQVKCYVLSHDQYEYESLIELGVEISRYDPERPYTSKSYFVNSLLIYLNILKFWKLQKRIACDIDKDKHDCVLINPCFLSWTPIVTKYIKSKKVYFIDGVYGRFYEPLIDASESPCMKVLVLSASSTASFADMTIDATGQLVIPNAANPTVNAAGEVAINTTAASSSPAT